MFSKLLINNGECIGKFKYLNLTLIESYEDPAYSNCAKCSGTVLGGAYTC
jgi:hypothetical protein